MPISVESSGGALTQRKLQALKRALTKKETDPVVQKVAWRTYARLVEKTPKGYTGQTRREWSVYKNTGSEGGYIVTNQSKVMLFLEKGTRDHGPVRARALYIPLNRKAAVGGWTPSLQIGTDYILRTRVKGIKAMRIVANQRPITLRWMKDAMRAHIQNVLSKF